MDKSYGEMEPSVFIGREADLISFSSNTISISFGNDLSITIVGSFCHTHDKSVSSDTVPVGHSDLMQLIGKAVVSSEQEVDGSLVLGFEDNHTLKILNDSDIYESYSVKVGDTEIFV